MDLNKDNRDIYTIDAESYTQQRKQHKEEPRSLLSFLINLLLFILAIVISFFLYNIIKNKYTLNDVLNKEKILNTFHISTEPTKAKEEVDDMEALAQQIVTSMDLEKSTQTVESVETVNPAKKKETTIVVEEKPKVSKIESVERKPKIIETVKVVNQEKKPLLQEEKNVKEEKIVKEEIAVTKEIVVKEEVAPIVVTPQVKEEEEKKKELVKIETKASKPIVVIPTPKKEPKEEDLLSDEYLKRMAEELNQL